MSGNSSTKHPYVRFFVSDWLGGTRGLRASEIGIYITLIALMYDRGGPLPDDPPRLARQCGCTAKCLEDTLQILIDDGKIERGQAGLWNKRVEAELDWRSKSSRLQREAAQKRWEKSNENNGASMPAHCRNDAGGMPFQSPESEPD